MHLALKQAAKCVEAKVRAIRPPVTCRNGRYFFRWHYALLPDWYELELNL
ncbi:MAG: hypothetical protein AB1589_18670 [Cyanobacteriota bacterium]